MQAPNFNQNNKKKEEQQRDKRSSQKQRQQQQVGSTMDDFDTYSESSDSCSDGEMDTVENLPYSSYPC